MCKWTRKEAAIILALLTVPVVCEAQRDTALTAGQRIVAGVDRVLDLRDAHGRRRTDTAYMRRAPERLRLKLRVNASGSNIVAEGSTDNERYKTTLEAQGKYTVSASASYRGLTLGVALNPAKLAGKNKDYEFNLNAYGNRMGADVIFHSANTFKGTIETDGGTVDVPDGLVSQNILYLNAYYALSARRFSYPAAFSQSWLQLRSCGSFMLGLSFMGGNLRVGHSDALDNDNVRLSMANIGVGVGYGYNYVLRRKWLFHLSTLPQLVVFSRLRTTVNGSREKSPYRFPNINAVGRIAVVRHFDRYFAGFTAVVNTSTMGDRDRLRLSSVKWRGRLFIGIKL